MTSTMSPKTDPLATVLPERVVLVEREKVRVVFAVRAKAKGVSAVREKVREALVVRADSRVKAKAILDRIETNMFHRFPNSHSLPKNFFSR